MFLILAVTKRMNQTQKQKTYKEQAVVDTSTCVLH